MGTFGSCCVFFGPGNVATNRSPGRLTTRSPGRIQKVDPPWGSIIYTIGALESRIRGFIISSAILHHTIPYSTILDHNILHDTSPELGLLLFGSSRGSEK